MASLPGNTEVADRFDLLADLLELEGAESFRVLAYRRAATRMRETSALVAQLALDGRAKDLQGIGKTIEEKIVQIVETGDIDALAKRRALVPPDVIAFMHLPGLGPKTAARIWRELDVTTLAGLKEAAETERLRTLAGLGPKSEEKILKALAFQADNPDEGRKLLGDGLPAVLAVVADLRTHPAAVAVSEAGSVRRRKETFRDLDIIATATEPADLTAYFTELDAARRGELPKLVELSDVRGDLHTHTTWSSDGKNTLEEMVAAAAARGYEYYAITDHSHYLREGRLAAQLEEIERVREKFPKLHILAGVEANIRGNGAVDVAAEDLARLDWVVASVHQAPHTRPTERVLEAMENPYVDCIGHLTGRRIGKRGPRDVDVERVIEKALETGCVLELNGQPDRLDLRDVHARAAKEAGLKLVVNSDAHRISAQGYVELAVGQARRGWLTKDDLANTRTWAQFRKLQRKRP